MSKITKSSLKKYKNVDLLNIVNQLNDNKDLTKRFIDDFIRITGYEIDSDGYLVDTEDDPFNPDYILIKNKALRYTNQGILHSKDLIFDPYNNPIIIEELFRRYCAANHPYVASIQIFTQNPDNKNKINSLGYITVLYENGSKIQTALHYKDSTKYLDAWCRMESMPDDDIKIMMKDYDEFEELQFKKQELEIGDI